MNLLVLPSGEVRCVYSETIDLHTLGKPTIRRASHVESDEHGIWWADLQPVQGPILGPYAFRSDALEAEQDWLEQFWLVPQSV